MRLYSKEHIWIETEGEIVRLGISDYAQERLGDIVFINLPDVEEEVHIGEAFGDVESVKTVSDLVSPVDGVVLTVNEDILEDLENINHALYEHWLIEVSIKKLSDELMDEKAYLGQREGF